MYPLIGTARINDSDQQTGVADLLSRIAETPQNRVHELLPRHWDAAQQRDLAA